MTTYLPATAGTDPGTVYAEVARRLAGAGSGPGDVVHITEYRTGAPGAADRERFLDGHRAPLSVVPVAGFPDPAHTFAVDLVLHPGGGTAVDTGDGGVLRVAGDLVHLPSVHTAEGAFRDQYTWCLRRIGELLAAAGLGLDALVRTTDFTATATRADVDAPHHCRATAYMVDRGVHWRGRPRLTRRSQTTTSRQHRWLVRHLHYYYHHERMTLALKTDYAYPDNRTSHARQRHAQRLHVAHTARRAALPPAAMRP